MYLYIHDMYLYIHSWQEFLSSANWPVVGLTVSNFHQLPDRKKPPPRSLFAWNQQSNTWEKSNKCNLPGNLQFEETNFQIARLLFARNQQSNSKCTLEKMYNWHLSTINVLREKSQTNATFQAIFNLRRATSRSQDHSLLETNRGTHRQLALWVTLLIPTINYQLSMT